MSEGQWGVHCAEFCGGGGGELLCTDEETWKLTLTEVLGNCQELGGKRKGAQDFCGY